MGELVHTCPQIDDPRGREWAMVTVRKGTPERRGRDGVWCDPCLVPIVKALNDGGLRTVASCCGHRVHEPSVLVDVEGVRLELVVRPFVPLTPEVTDA